MRGRKGTLTQGMTTTMTTLLPRNIERRRRNSPRRRLQQRPRADHNQQATRKGVFSNMNSSQLQHQRYNHDGFIAQHKGPAHQQHAPRYLTLAIQLAGTTSSTWSSIDLCSAHTASRFSIPSVTCSTGPKLSIVLRETHVNKVSNVFLPCEVVTPSLQSMGPDDRQSRTHHQQQRRKDGLWCCWARSCC